MIDLFRFLPVLWRIQGAEGPGPPISGMIILFSFFIMIISVLDIDEASGPEAHNVLDCFL